MHSKLRSILLKVLLYSNRCENSCVNKPDLLRDAALHDESLKYFLNHVRSVHAKNDGGQWFVWVCVRLINMGAKGYNLRIT